MTDVPEAELRSKQATSQPFMTTEEVAELLRVSPETVRWWVWRGENGLRSFKVGRRRLFDRTDVEAFIAAARSGNHAA